MYETKYHSASTTDEAVSIMGSADDGKFVAGGQTLIPTMKQRLAAPSDLIDLCAIDAMKGISIDGNQVTIGACTTHAEVASNIELKAACSALCDLAATIGDPAVRHRGTIGGSIANNDPAADYPAAMMALNAQIVTNKRTIDTDDFFNGLFETALADDEIITAVTFPAPSKAAYCKFPNPASRYAMAGVFVAKLKNGMARVGVTGAGSDGVFRHEGMEAALSSDWSADAIAGESVDAGDMLSDIHADSAYRANLVKVMASRAIAAAG
ncbi:MAG: xanthine dehydrogenase family protein subunit M [Rhizobiaceae bacterium]|nr:xanthine dehydrogenase family protein subunit M [Rhizobiaceae bacterium]